MSIERPTIDWNVEDIDLMLALLPIIESRDFVPFIWPKLPEGTENGDRVLQMAHPTYHDVVEQLWNLLYETSAYIDPYAPLPEDPTQDGIGFSVMGTHFPSEYFTSATVNQVRRYLVLCTRGERFCDGHIAGEFECGAIQAALRRLKELRQNPI